MFRALDSARLAAWVEADHEGRTLDDQGDGAIGEPLGAKLAAAVGAH